MMTYLQKIANALQGIVMLGAASVATQGMGITRAEMAKNPHS